MKAISSLFLLLALAACVPEEPYWDDVCVKEHTEFVYMPMMVGKIMINRMQPVIKCDEYKTMCIAASEQDKCPPIREEQIK